MADLRPLAVLIAMLAVTGCGGGAPTGSLGDDAALTSSRDLAVDLETGEVRAVAIRDDADLAQDGWRDRWMLFRRIPSTAGAGTRWIGVFEVTRAQWRHLAGEEAARDPTLGPVQTMIHPGAAMPATGVAASDAVRVIAGLHLSAFTLRLPTGGEWRAACDAGVHGYTWGDGEAALVTKAYAVCLRAGENCAPRQVGSLAANATGCFDIHGNAWELTDDGSDGFHIRGGAYDSPIEGCRADLAVSIPAGLAHPTVGMRLVLAP